MVEDDDWLDITRLESSFQEQMTPNGSYRHRPLRIFNPPRSSREAVLRGEEIGIGEWLPGPAPD